MTTNAQNRVPLVPRVVSECKSSDWCAGWNSAVDAANAAETELVELRKRYADAESRVAFCDGDLEIVLAERDALRAKIAASPRGTVTGFGSCGAWLVDKADKLGIYPPMVNKRVHLVELCDCGQRDRCVEPWEPGCGLGQSAEHAQRVG